MTGPIGRPETNGYVIAMQGAPQLLNLSIFLNPTSVRQAAQTTARQASLPISDYTINTNGLKSLDGLNKKFTAEGFSKAWGGKLAGKMVGNWHPDSRNNRV